MMLLLRVVLSCVLFSLCLFSVLLMIVCVNKLSELLFQMAIAGVHTSLVEGAAT